MQHTHADHPAAPKTAVPQVPSSQMNRYIDYAPGDDDIYRQRYYALRDLVWALEDENNMIALKIAQTTTRLKMLEEAEASGQKLQPPGTIASPVPKKRAQNGDAKGKKTKRKAESQTPEIAPPFTTAALTPAHAGAGPAVDSTAGSETHPSPAAVTESTSGPAPSHSQQSHPVDEDGDSIVDDY